MPRKNTIAKSSGNNKTQIELKTKIAELEENKQRLAAEFANYQRRAETDRIVERDQAQTKILEKLFPIVDNLERASAHVPEVSLENFNKLTEADFHKLNQYFLGLRMIEKQLETTLAQAGLKRIATQNEPFNHHLHEAISYEPNIQVPADHIISEIESGWQINGKVVRPAKVRVSQG